MAVTNITYQYYGYCVYTLSKTTSRIERIAAPLVYYPGFYWYNAAWWNYYSYYRPGLIFDPTWNYSTSPFVLAEQDYLLFIAALKPNTQHRFYIEGVDLTEYTKQTNTIPTVTNQTLGLDSTSSGIIRFFFFFGASLAPNSKLSQQEQEKLRTGGQKVFEVKNADGTSIATGLLTLPKYATPATPQPGPDKPVDPPAPVVPMRTFACIQTFYVDPAKVKSATEIGLTRVDLYFSRKPGKTNNFSGMEKPGATISICQVELGIPNNMRVFPKSVVRKEYDEIIPSGDASVPTAFSFEQPLKLKTGDWYGVVVTFDDPGYDLWTNIAGDVLVGSTNRVSPGSTISDHDGSFYVSQNYNANDKNFERIWKPRVDQDLKFAIKCAEYIGTTSGYTTDTFTNKNYEFFTINNKQGKFYSGETVFQFTANSSGNVAFTAGKNEVKGTGTNFNLYNRGDSVILYHDDTTINAYKISSIVNSSVMYLTSNTPVTNTATRFKIPVTGTVYYQNYSGNKLYLNDSSANSTAVFTPGSIIIGTDSYATANIVSIDAFTVDRVRLKGDVSIPAGTKIDTKINFAAFTGAAYAFSGQRDDTIQINDVGLKDINKYDAFILSRSLEVNNGSLFTNADLFIYNKSMVVTANLGMSTSVAGDLSYHAPQIDLNVLDLYCIQNERVAGDDIYYYNSNNVLVDSEIESDAGLAVTRHISSKLTFANNRNAEDVRMFMTAYRPPNTDIKAYVRIHHPTDPDAFDDGSWTPLELVENESKFSSLNDENDFIEYEWGIPQYPESSTILPGTVATGSSSNVVTTTKKFDVNFNANTALRGNNFITVNNSFTSGEQVFYYTDTGNTVITNLTNTSPYYVVSANSTAFRVSKTIGGTPIAISNSSVVETGHHFSYIIPGDVVRIYDTQFVQNYVVRPVASVNSTAVVVSDTIIEAGINGTSGLKIEKCKYKHVAFNNIYNDNVSRYYNTSLQAVDGFNAMQIKVVLLSDNSYKVPKVQQLQCIGVSA